MAIHAKVAWEYDERKTGGPYWIMVEPVNAPLGSPRWAHATIASGKEVTLAIADKEGQEMPRTRVKILGYEHGIGGKVDGQEVLSSPEDWEKLGDYKVSFLPGESRSDFADDLRAINKHKRDKIFEEGNKYIKKLEGYQKQRQEFAENPGLLQDIKEKAGEEILNGLDSGLLELRVK